MKTLLALAFLSMIFSSHATNLVLQATVKSNVVRDWKVESQGGDNIENPWHWVVLTNRNNSDTLSLAYQKTEDDSYSKILDNYHDTSIELFPTGEWSLARKSKEHSLATPIRSEVKRFEGGTMKEWLEYSFVTELRPANNYNSTFGTSYLSHGYAFFVSDKVVFIQHTSQRPISYSFAEDVARKVSRELRKMVGTEE